MEQILECACPFSKETADEIGHYKNCPLAKEKTWWQEKETKPKKMKVFYGGELDMSKNIWKEFEKEFIYNNHGKRYLYNDEYLENDIKAFFRQKLEELFRWVENLSPDIITDDEEFKQTLDNIKQKYL